MPQLTRIRNRLKFLQAVEDLKDGRWLPDDLSDRTDALIDYLSDLLPSWSRNHVVAYSGVLACLSYERKPMVYHVTEDFFQALQTVSPRAETAFSVETEFRLFSFGGDSEYIGGFITKMVDENKFHSIFVYLESRAGHMSTMLFEDHGTWGEVIDRSRQFEDMDSCTRNSLVGLINANLYVTSENAITEMIPPNPRLNKTIKKQILESGNPWNPDTVPAILVNWNFRHPRLRHVSETAVKGHFRWQPCGEQRSKRRLIWIDEHIRRYDHDNT
jgi:hypothetical protein